VCALVSRLRCTAALVSGCGRLEHAVGVSVGRACVSCECCEHALVVSAASMR
jgi:hypothetical protein